MKETKHQKFQRLAEARTNRILEQIEILGNLSNASNYEYSKEEVDKIFRTLEGALKRVKLQFDDPHKFEL